MKIDCFLMFPLLESLQALRSVLHKLLYICSITRELCSVCGAPDRSIIASVADLFICYFYVWLIFDAFASNVLNRKREVGYPFAHTLFYFLNITN